MSPSALSSSQPPAASSVLVEADKPAFEAHKPLRLRRRLTWWATMFSVVPVLLVGGLSYLVTSEAISRRSQSAQRLQTESVAADLQEFLEDHFRQAAAIAAQEIFTDANLRQAASNEQKKQTLNAFQQRLGAIESLAFLDPNGQLQFQADSGQPLADTLNQEVIQRAIATRQTTPSRLGIAGEAPAPIDYAAPVIDGASEQVVGIIYMRIPHQALQVKLETLETAQNRWYIVDAEAQVVSSVNPAALGQSATQQWSQLPEQITIQQARADRQGDALVSYAPLPISEVMPRQTLGVMQVADTVVALGASRTLLQILMLGTGLTAVVAAIVAFWQSQRLTKPLRLATNAMEQIGQGHLQPEPLPETGELGAMGERLNQMAAGVRQQLAELSAGYEKDLQRQQSHWQQEAQQLQADVQHILDVLDCLEAGDWTAQAMITQPPLAGLGTQLNQFVAALIQILSQLAATAQQLQERTGSLETTAVAIVDKMQHQEQTVGEVHSAIATVDQLNQQTHQQIATTHSALTHREASLTQGHQELANLTTSLNALQQGTSQIVQRTQTLAEFVDLAAQFSKEQKRVASQTRVLALNASMLASRATGQQDPSQFASVAHEFETIAQQINDLAVEANQNLILLRQRSDQIQTVVSGLDQDVQAIDAMVGSFSTGIGDFQGVFGDLDGVTGETHELMQQLQHSSTTVTAALKTALEKIQTMETITGATQSQAHLTQAEAAAVGTATQTLHQHLGEFRLSIPAKDQPTVIL